jgi:hypothetical protein
MTLSPPISVLTILVGALTATAWLTPPPARSAGMSVKLPLAIYEQLASRAKGRSDVSGHPLTVVQIIEELAAGNR